ncbi:hypothetical protein H072_5116 [Dactylellina haptotyla CBS 200.50]|uniref:J domain-containing protein n=1 Tax=Dactylellina haptotyla (strain CBS 200.50) TaxID=1284197 RepID=S8C056_DACHA|nr:hypothetical protein H072_5116 [Dactylellina haptotyla CBS 200.50]
MNLTTATFTSRRLAGRVLSTCARRPAPPAAATSSFITAIRPPYPGRYTHRTCTSTLGIHITRSPSRQYSTESTTITPSPLPQKTYYTLFPATLSAGPPPLGPFEIDTRQLRSEFLKRQQSTHPDLFPPSERKKAETASAQLNKAYTTLLDPLKRAEYLLTLRGYIDPSSDETQKLEDHELIMQVLEANEVLEAAEKEEDLEELKGVNTKRVEESVKLIGELFERDELERVRVEVMRLRYWTNVGEGLRHWEPGRGVVLQH